MQLSRLWRGLPLFRKTQNQSPYHYSPTPWLPNHAFQSIYEVFSPAIPIQYERQKIFFVDGGHVSLDWVNKYPSQNNHETVPILLIMHGMTGGSQCKYMQIMAKMSQQRGYTCVCLNSRGFNSDMTSPIPFIGLHFTELQATLQRIKTYYPHRPLHLVGMSLGGNYLLRYLLREGTHNHLTQNIRSLCLACPPFDVKYVIHNMNQLYQKYFIKYYINSVVCRHDQMSFWWNSGLVDLAHMKASTNLLQFHQRITQKIMGEPIDDTFDRFKVEGQVIEKFPFKTLIVTARDDQMVSVDTVPIESIRRNQNIKFILTEGGGHMCWFQGIQPQRWYPRPIFQFIQDIQKGKRVKDII